MQRNVRTSIEGGVFLITIDHAPVNAIDPQTLFDLESALEAFIGEPVARVAILASANRTIFVSGADISAFAGMAGSGRIGEFILRGQALVERISACPKPVIAAINGLALGGGLELALACHLRIVSERAKLGLPEVNLGLNPGWGGTQKLPRIIGPARAAEMILLGESISAQQALQLNLVNRVVPRDEVMPVAKEMAVKIAGKPDLAIRSAMASIHAATEMGLAEGLAFEARQLAALAESEAAQERISAFLNKHSGADH